MLAVVVTVGGSSSFEVHDLDAIVAGEPVLASPLAPSPAPRAGRGLGGGCWCWTASGDAIVYAAADGNLWLLPLDDRPAKQLTDHGPDRVAQAPFASADGTLIVYVVDQAEVWSIAAGGGPGTRLDDGSAEFCFDPAVSPSGDEIAWHAWSAPHMPWDHSWIERLRLSTGERSRVVPAGSVQQPVLLRDDALLCVRDDHGWANLWLDDRPLVDEPFEHAGPTWGLRQRSFAVSPAGDRVAFTRNEAGFGRLCVLERTSGRVTEVGRGVHGQLTWVGDRITALRSGARTPTEVVVLTAPDGTADWVRRSVVVGPTATWDRDLLVEPELVDVPAGDGSIVHARLFRADRDERGGSDDGDGERLICWLHGGPTDQWQVTFMPRIAYWRAQGWNVLVPDHRGSTGHGRAYQQQLAGRWGELDVADTATVLGHAHRAGWGTPARTALFGSSAGGFTVLGVLGHHPGLAAAAVVAYPVSDLVDLTERSHRFERHSTWSLVGVPGSSPEVEARYRDRSPVSFAARITAPLLVLHGEDDAVVPVGQSRVLVERIRATGGLAELVVYPGEGHGFRQRDHQLDEYARTAEFLGLHIPCTLDHR